MHHQIFSLATYILTTSITTALTINSPTIIRGATSCKANDCESFASCPSPSTLISCGIESDTRMIDGSEVIPYGPSGGIECRAQNGEYNTAGITAVAACSNTIDLDPSKFTCSYYSGFISGIFNDDSFSVNCPADKTIISCSIRSNFASIDGSFIGDAYLDTNIISSTPCTAYNSGSSFPSIPGEGGSWPHAVCCEYNDDNYELDCKTKWSPQSAVPTTASPVSTSVTCDAGYGIMGCSGYGPYDNLASYYIKGDACIAKAQHNGGVAELQGAVATCCRLNSIPDQAKSNVEIEDNMDDMSKSTVNESESMSPFIMYIIYGAIGLISMIIICFGVYVCAKARNKYKEISNKSMESVECEQDVEIKDVESQQMN